MPDEYSNPLAPAEHHKNDVVHSGGHGTEKSHPLRNEDFRRLLTTPRVSAGGGDKQQQVPSAAHSFSHKGSHGDSRKKHDAKHQKKPKHFRPKKEEDEGLSEILKSYRDRARERREGEVTEQHKDIDLLQATAGYRAVAPDTKSTMDAAERRKQLIEESKYLGGDMDHTHLVKGLDYALLQKMRSEIVIKEKESEEIEKAYQERSTERDEVEGQLKTVLAKNVYNLLFKDEPLKINEMFAPRRMAYVVELDEENAESDIPTTLIRSKQDCPVDESSANLSINDVVIHKLTQVLSYLRTDGKKKKKEKGKDKFDETKRAQLASQNIFEGTGEYIPNIKKTNVKKEKKDASYFDKNDKDEKDERVSSNRDKKDRDRYKSSKQRDEEKDSTGRRQGSSRIAEEQTNSSFDGKRRGTNEEKPSSGTSTAKHDRDPLQKSTSKDGVRTNSVPDSYAECYPGGYECYDAAGDSDDEADYSKMDLGNKKGPIRRWDFDTEEEYETYMSRREAMPKAAFQYGVKTNDGRKTRKVQGAKNEQDQKAKIDREWEKISKIISKRKGEGESEGGEVKKPKY